ncbi:MAG TPA: hypothetical protein VFH49_02790, partial [Aquabacterium sp.]|nr:hypothetical protein [Aquabacterium sp.]
MTQHSPSWWLKLLAGKELQRHSDILAEHERARQDAEAAMNTLKGRLAEVESELKVRTDIMNVTSIVSEADKKGDIVSVNDKFIQVSK